MSRGFGGRQRQARRIDQTDSSQAGERRTFSDLESEKPLNGMDERAQQRARKSSGRSSLFGAVGDISDEEEIEEDGEEIQNGDNILNLPSTLVVERSQQVYEVNKSAEEDITTTVQKGTDAGNIQSARDDDIAPPAENMHELREDYPNWEADAGNKHEDEGFGVYEGDYDKESKDDVESEELVASQARSVLDTTSNDVVQSSMLNRSAIASAGEDSATAGGQDSNIQKAPNQLVDLIPTVKLSSIEDVDELKRLPTNSAQKLENLVNRLCSKKLKKENDANTKSLIVRFNEAVSVELQALSRTITATSKTSQHLSQAERDQKLLMQQLVEVWRERKLLARELTELQPQLELIEPKYYLGDNEPQGSTLNDTFSTTSTMLAQHWSILERLESTATFLQTNLHAQTSRPENKEKVTFTNN